MRFFTPKALVGQYVRFAGLPEDCKPTPIRITAVTKEGMLRLEGWAGDFSPQMFVVVNQLPRRVLSAGDRKEGKP